MPERRLSLSARRRKKELPGSSYNKSKRVIVCNYSMEEQTAMFLCGGKNIAEIRPEGSRPLKAYSLLSPVPKDKDDRLYVE